MENAYVIVERKESVVSNQEEGPKPGMEYGEPANTSEVTVASKNIATPAPSSGCIGNQRPEGGVKKTFKTISEEVGIEEMNRPSPSMNVHHNLDANMNTEMSNE